MTATLLSPLTSRSTSPLPVLIVPAPDSPPTPPDTVCRCGGLLIYVASERVKLTKSALRRLHTVVTLVEHVEACAECLDGGDPRDCRHLHRACEAPEAEQCEHAGCIGDTRSPLARPCASAHTHCCGCCWATYYGDE